MDSGYVYHALFFTSVVKQMVDSVAGSSYPAMTATTVAGLRMPLPPAPEQKAVAAVLSVWERGIKQLGAMIDTKLRAKQGLVQHLLTGKWLHKGCPRTTWVPTPLHEVFDKVRKAVDVTPDKEYTEIGIRSHGNGVFHKEPVPGSKLGEKHVFWVEPGCLTLNIVFAWEQAVAVTSEAERGMIASHRFPMFRPDPRRVCPEYVLLYLLSWAGKHLLGLASPGGAGRNRTLSQTKFLKTIIPLPSIEEQQRIVAAVNAADREICQLRQQVALLREQKKGLLQKLLTGQVRVKVHP